MMGFAADDELVPVADRHRWTLIIRVALVAFVAGYALTAEPGSGRAQPLAVAAVAWLCLTAAFAPFARRRRRAAVLAITLGLLGDGVLLGITWWVFGGLAGQLGPLIALHAIAATLLVSFRTGVKITVWHSLVALLLLESGATGRFGPARAVPVLALTGYLCGLWLVVIATAAFAAANERELRRRRYDGDVLRKFALLIAGDQAPADVMRQLARFARNNLVATRTAVIMYPQGEQRAPQPGSAVVVDETGERTVTGLPADAMDRLVGEVRLGAPTRLLKRLDPATDPGLAGLLPGARRIVLVPFAVEQARGALLVEHGRRSSQRSSNRVERRMVSTAEQATLNASLALGRALLTEQIHRTAQTDALTGIANRRTLMAAVERAAAATATGGPPFGLLMLDLDHFKRLNDTHGHQAGDDVLRGAAHALRDTCGERDLPARYGGEEFAVVVHRATAEEVAEVAEQLRLAVARSSAAVPVTASLGAAMCPANGTNAAALFAVADAALYEAKRGGRNRVVVAWSDAGGTEVGRVPLRR